MSWMTERLEGSGDYIVQNQNVRSEPRIKTGAYAVMVQGECQRTYGYARDLSRSGMQIRTFSLCDDWPKPVGDRLRLEFSIPNKGLHFSCDAKVVWSSTLGEDRRVMSLQGVRFEDMDPSVQAKIDELAGTVH
ncbi:MAG: PilZ domain-containing protein [Nitrospirae bacterium]|nr:PilZ domain-containing protein [Nitrospirota bacterium]MBI5695702.1 PilZ domain-containing protein [Nitrospirota bacterium]